MKRTRYSILLLFLLLTTPLLANDFSIDDIIEDIYHQMSEQGEPQQEELENTLLYYYQNPIDINHTTSAELSELVFLSQDQIDNLLSFVHSQPVNDLSELRLVRGFRDYELRNLRYFITITPQEKTDKIYGLRDLMHSARQEAIVRTDIRNMEAYSGDPVFAQARYQISSRDRILAGLQIRRNPGTTAREMEYGGYIQLNRIGPMKTAIIGNFNADFGLGLVTSTGFHMGKSAYVTNVGVSKDKLTRYSGTIGNSLHGVGTTFGWQKNGIQGEVTAFYSLTRTNDSIRRHVVGANANIRWNRLKVGVTAVENIYSDTLRYYYEHAGYNQNYFRGIRQAVIGADFRYNWGRWDLFGEVATAQNKKGWGVATTVGLRMTPIDQLGLVLLYRYYSPLFDNTLGYSFSETSRINDENGVYLGIDYKGLKDWRLSAYGDVFRFDGIKYGIPYAPSWGYDALGQAEYIPNSHHQLTMRFRAKEKGGKSLYSLRNQYRWEAGNWSLTSKVEGNIGKNSLATLTYGVAVLQDVKYLFEKQRLTIGGRIAYFYAPNWDNRIYTYENDVLYGYSIPALYGHGVRGYLNLRWVAVENGKIRLTTYLRLSEMVYTKAWAEKQKKTLTDTDLHLMMRLTF